MHFRRNYRQNATEWDHSEDEAQKDATARSLGRQIVL